MAAVARPRQVAALADLDADARECVLSQSCSALGRMSTRWFQQRFKQTKVPLLMLKIRQNKRRGSLLRAMTPKNHERQGGVQWGSGWNGLVGVGWAALW